MDQLKPLLPVMTQYARRAIRKGARRRVAAVKLACSILANHSLRRRLSAARVCECDSTWPTWHDTTEPHVPCAHLLLCSQLHPGVGPVAAAPSAPFVLAVFCHCHIARLTFRLKRLRYTVWPIWCPQQKRGRSPPVCLHACWSASGWSWGKGD